MTGRRCCRTSKRSISPRDRNLIDVRFPVQYVIRPQTHEHHDYRSYCRHASPAACCGPATRSSCCRVGMTTPISRDRRPDRAGRRGVPTDGGVDPPRRRHRHLPGRHDRADQQPAQGQPGLRRDGLLDGRRRRSGARPRLRASSTPPAARARSRGLDYRLDVNTLHRDKIATARSSTSSAGSALRTQARCSRRVHPQRQHRIVHPHRPDRPTEQSPPEWCCARVRCARPSASSPNTVQAPVPGERRRTGLAGARRCGSPACPAPASPRWRCSSSASCSKKGVPAYVLDGDNLRHGLNADLGFSMADRAENLRRLAHVARLLADSGQVVLVPAISPLEEHRALARRLHEEAGLPFVRGVL